MSVTACLITYNRPGNLGRIIDTLEHLPFISEILIRDHSKDPHPGQWEVPRWNTINYGRYQLAAQAANDLIYSQDDDCIIDIDNLVLMHAQFLAMLRSSQWKLAPTPNRRILFGLAPTHVPMWPSYDFGSVVMAIAGWGMFFDRRWLQTPDRCPECGLKMRVPRVRTLCGNCCAGGGPDQGLQPTIFREYIERWGMDATFYRETDRIFSLLLNRRHVPFEVQVRHLPGHDQGLSSQVVHAASRQLVIDRCLDIIKEEEST